MIALAKVLGSEPSHVSGIAVVRGGSFTAQRMAVVAANTLSLLLGVPVHSVHEAPVCSTDSGQYQGFAPIQPAYSAEPNITHLRSA